MKELLRNPDSFYKVLELTVSTLDIDAMFTEVVEELRELFDSERCTLYVLDKEAHELYTKIAQKCKVEKLHIPVNKKTLIGYTVLTDSELIINDAYDERELRKIDVDLGFGRKMDEKCDFRTKSVLCAPIKYKGAIIGAFQAFNKPGGYLKKDVNALREFGLILGLALNNALVVEELKVCRSEKAEQSQKREV